MAQIGKNGNASAIANPIIEEGEEEDDGTEDKDLGGHQDSAISGFDDDSASMPPPAQGHARFDNLLKSLILRIEMTNTLAPI
jgi:hypothetical protein